jgi:FlaA1/EpsC-like NDP-sugar epimerase
MNYQVKGFVYDKRGKKGLLIHGVPVLGRVEQLPELVARHQIHEILIAVPSATGEEMRHIVSICDACGVRFKTLPGIGELINGNVSVKALRDVNYQDLLGRPAVKLKEAQIRDYLHNQVVLITGAGGSIGSELCRQIVRFNPKQLILMDVSEPSLYEIQMELKHGVGYLDYVMVLGAVQNERLVDRMFRKYRPHVVFHAAAYKHVPMLERNPWQAVWNNIRGAQVMMEKAVEMNAGRFILVSTDKAVRPTNVMGTSKRCCERLLQAHSDSRTRMMAVRFGNVVGSAGSVGPLFRRQIEAGGPVTVTHPEVTRYFMTIPEACQLILQAGAIGAGGEVFVLEMGTPVKIADMARDLIRLSGKEPGRDIAIVFSGLRPGEKLYEELITEGEGIISTEHEDIMVLRSDGHGDQEGYREWLMMHLDELYRIADTFDACAIKAKLNEIVPEYVVQDAECVL